MTRQSLSLAFLLVATPTLAAERGLPASAPERIAFALFFVGTLVFFGWVVWLVIRR